MIIYNYKEGYPRTWLMLSSNQKDIIIWNINFRHFRRSSRIFSFSSATDGVCLSVSLSIWISPLIHLSLSRSSLCLSVRPSVCLSFCLSVGLPMSIAWLYVCPSVCQSDCLSVYCLSIYLEVYLSICPPRWIFIEDHKSSRSKEGFSSWRSVVVVVVVVLVVVVVVVVGFGVRDPN